MLDGGIPGQMASINSSFVTVCLEADTNAAKICGPQAELPLFPIGFVSLIGFALMAPISVFVAGYAVSIRFIAGRGRRTDGLQARRRDRTTRPLSSNRRTIRFI
jgi:hypothetical protein